MRTTQNNIKIELESEEEINIFWNIIAFALDLHVERDIEGKSCMTQDELEMAHKLFYLTEKKW